MYSRKGIKRINRAFFLCPRHQHHTATPGDSFPSVADKHLQIWLCLLEFSLLHLGHRGLAGVHLPCAQGGGEGVGVGVVLLHANGHAQHLVGVLGGLLHLKGLDGSLHHETAVLLGSNAIGGTYGGLLQDSEPLVEIGCGTCIETYTGEDGTK